MDENANFGRGNQHNHAEGYHLRPNGEGPVNSVELLLASGSSSSNNSSSASTVSSAAELSSISSIENARRCRRVDRVKWRIRDPEYNVSPLHQRCRKNVAEKIRLQSQHHYDFLLSGKPPPDVKELIELDDFPSSPEIELMERMLRVFTLFLLADGGAMLMCVVLFGTGFGFTAYFRHFLQHNELVLWLTVISVIQPILTAAYCTYAKNYPASLRPYYLRSTILIFVPCMLVVVAGIYLYASHDFLKNQLAHVLQLFVDDTSAKDLWNILQTEMSCCGIDGYNDWKRFDFGNEHNLLYPISCCKAWENCSREETGEVWPSGCFTPLYKSVLSIGFTFIGMALLQIVFQAATIHFAKKMYKIIERELMDERTTMEVLFGPCCCSLCSSNHNQFELTEESMLQTFPFLRNAGGDLCQSSREQLDTVKRVDF